MGQSGGSGAGWGSECGPVVMVGPTVWGRVGAQTGARVGQGVGIKVGDRLGWTRVAAAAAVTLDGDLKQFNLWYGTAVMVQTWLQPWQACMHHHGMVAFIITCIFLQNFL